MNRVLILMLFLVAASFAQAQVISITDKLTKEPLDLVTLISQDPKAFALTNVKGKADIATFKSSEKILVRLLGYKPITTNYLALKQAGFVLQMEVSQITMDVLVVSANRAPQSLRDLPVKITTVGSKQVQLANPQTAADLLAISNEVFIQKSQQGGGSPMIRGFSTNRLLYTVDGVRMNTAIFRSGNIQNVISLDPFAIQNTEVLFGPGSVTYGSDAIGGVMNFQTLTPQLSLNDTPLVTGNAQLRFSSANTEQTGHFDINVGWEKWAMLTSFSSFDYGDLMMGSNGPEEYLRPYFTQRIDGEDVVLANANPKLQVPTAYSQMNVMQKIRYTPNKNWDVQYGFHYSETSNNDRYDRLLRTKNGDPRYGEWYYGPQKWMMNNVSISNQKETALYDEFRIRLAQQYFEESRISRDFNKDNRENRTEKVDAYSLNLDFTKQLFSKHKLFYGVEVINNTVKSEGIDEDIAAGSSARGATRYPQSTWNSYAIFATDMYEINKKLNLQAGLRYNQFVLDADFDTTFYKFPFTNAKINNGALTGSLGLVYHPTEKWMLSTNLSTGFRSPNVDDLGKVFDSAPGYVIVPNPDLEAEYAYNAELSIAKAFGDWLRVDVTGFYTILDNAMVRRDYTLNGQDSMMYDGTMSKIEAIQNAASAYVYGVEGGFEAKFKSGFGFSSRLNYQRGREELDDGTTAPLRSAAPLFGNTTFSYNYGKLNMQFYANYSGEVKFEDMPTDEIAKDYMYAIDEDGNPYSPKWITLNFKAMYHVSSDLMLSAGLENLLDKRYRSYSSGIVAPGRNFVLSFKYVF